MKCTFVTLVPGETDGPVFLSAPPPAVMVPCPLDALKGTDRCALHAKAPEMTLEDAWEPLVTEPEPYDGGPTTL